MPSRNQSLLQPLLWPARFWATVIWVFYSVNKGKWRKCPQLWTHQLELEWPLKEVFTWTVTKVWEKLTWGLYSPILYLAFWLMVWMELDVGLATNPHTFTLVVDRLDLKIYHRSLVGSLKCVYIGHSISVKGNKWGSSAGGWNKFGVGIKWVDDVTPLANPV